MSKNIRFIQVLIACPLIAISQEEEWRWVAPYPPRLQVSSAAVVGNGAFFWCAEYMVMSTTDGGNSFTVTQYAPTADVALDCCNKHGIAFADSLTGYIVDISSGHFRTTDGGKHWIQVGNPNPGIEMVEFGSNMLGWKIGVQGTYRTEDGGISWSRVAAAPGTGGVFSNVHALDENRVWVMTSYYAGRPPDGFIWHSQNSGISWTRVNTGIYSGVDTQVTYNSMKINSSGVGFALGSIYRLSMNTTEAFVLKTSDFGKNWTYRQIPDGQWSDVSSITDSVWVAFGNSGLHPIYQSHQLRTTDMGETWLLSEPFATGDNSYVYTGVYIKPSNQIVAVTLDGIYRSSDQGQSYIRLTSERDITITDVILDKRPTSSNEQVVIAKSTYNHSYLLSTDAGTSWRRLQIPQSVGSQIWGTRIVNDHIYMIANQMRLFRSTDLGTSWERLTVPTSGALRALDAYDRNTLAIQGFPNVLSSSNGGVRWAPGPFPGTMWLNETAIASPSKIVAVGGFYDSAGVRGIIYRTSNNGLSWRIMDTQGEMTQVSMINESVGFAMGTSHLYKTTNSGETWTISRSSYGSAFCFENLTHGILRTTYFTFETFDGGITWQQSQIRIPIQYQIYKMAYNVRGELLVAGNGRLVIRSAGGRVLENTAVNREVKKPILRQNTPNPFNPSTTISFELPDRSYVGLVVYDILGRKVATLLNELIEPGNHSVPFDGNGLASGIYFYRLHTPSGPITRKMILIK